MPQRGDFVFKDTARVHNLAHAIDRLASRSLALRAACALEAARGRPG
jgi:hypothetical protein